MRILSAASWIKQRGLWMVSIQSALTMPPLFSRSRFLGADVGSASLSSILLTWLFDDVMPSSYSVPPRPALS